jgi:competence CoiA-like predicted nuclease
MRFAFVGGIRTEATSRELGVCPLCHSAVRGYAGKIIINHWKHISKVDCDSWYEPETEWHRKWKNLFPDEWQENIIEKNGKKHIADIFNPVRNLVIEFQNSHISVDELHDRECFYDRMIWVVNITPYIDNIEWIGYWHSQYRKDVVTPVQNKCYLYRTLIRLITKVYEEEYNNESDAKLRLEELCSYYKFKNFDRLRDSLSKIHLTNLSPNDFQESQNLLFKLIIDRKEGNDDEQYLEAMRAQEQSLVAKYTTGFEPKQRLSYLKWKMQHKHWNYADKPVFFDSGSENLYMVTDNWKQGNGFIVKSFLKVDFIKKYCTSVLQH